MGSLNRIPCGDLVNLCQPNSVYTLPNAISLTLSVLKYSSCFYFTRINLINIFLMKKTGTLNFENDILFVILFNNIL